MVGGVSSSVVIPFKASAPTSKINQGFKGAKLDLENLPKSKVKLDSQFTGHGQGLKIDIKV
ncbi:hypothetical protein [Kordiimonas marina]|uniref:hypothetical protein n=1 Tax=Kordiimonas marina TaxID=2872312 RepID=UPI001FF2AE9B|nr:hypothetical protein [Kordiimonas marina]MCJ9429499.1 hypothetical protein [Kordiimonas marina]